MNTRSALVLFTGSLLFGLLLCYIDDETHSVMAVFAPGMLLIAFLYSIPLFFILLTIRLLRFNTWIAYGSLLLVAFLFTFGLIGFTLSHISALIFYSIIFFLVFAGTFYISKRLSLVKTEP